MTTVEAPTGAELVDRATKLIPLLQKHALWSDQNRRLHDEVVEALADAGFYRMRTPARYGGFESDARTMVDVSAELARGDGAVGWTTQVSWIPTWMAGMFPDEVQDEVFSTPDVRLCGTLSPTGMATPVDGGYTVNGQWGFISGALHSHWQEIIVMSPTPDGGMQPLMGLVPMSDLAIVDDWHAAGLRGSGSVSTAAQDLFVPEARMIPLGAILQGQSASVANADSPMYRSPLLGVATASSVGTPLGLARAARDEFMLRLPNRKITYTAYEAQREAPITHLQVAEAALKTDAAEFHGRRTADLLDAKGVSGESWTLEERVRARADVGAVCQLAKEAVDLLAGASGGSSIYETAPIQRVARNIQAINLHALMYPQTAYELYGRVLSGLEPNSFYI
ncbi:acyl-CoA dehydrogenase family protein [Kitasatospora sp. SUK 42]|uniref:acyl-CoA dehydrogenase family protein n=1 Tax=Kitasatospora sp. SUK 42 TaxID=1588882 RepID=UPI0018CB7982|nr:acyl-CoA dehydrogenase family protein [Kitasatospora sp. SUK 42]MBV2156589.1 acyl-CoA dehydrogenase family protein [Kitasatospora sp. SUK 42]